MFDILDNSKSSFFMLITCSEAARKNGKQVFDLCASRIEVKNGQGLAISCSEHSILYFSELL